MQCPDCSHEMDNVTLGTNPPIQLDVCSYCGGIWTDQGEANFFKESDLMAIGIPPRHVHQVKTPSYRSCPKDATPLTRFRGESVPEGIVVYRCETCGGSWFPTGQLVKFKRAQRAKLRFFKTWHLPIASAYAILLPIFLIFIITGGLIVTVRSIQEQQQLESQAKSLVGKPVVRAASPNDVFISFTTQGPVGTSLTYWKDTAPEEKITRTVNSQPQTTHSVHLFDLSANTPYVYQITLRTTQPVTTEEFRFTTLSD